MSNNTSTIIYAFKVTCPYCEQVFYELDEIELNGHYENCPYCNKNLEVLEDGEHYNEYVEEIEIKIELDYVSGEVYTAVE